MPLTPFKNTAHRGLFDNDRGTPENSMAAFEAAIAGGYAIELDLQLTDDRELVVFHDDDTERMTGHDRVVAFSTLHQLRQLRLLDTDQRIPLFADVLERVAGRVPLLIELKHYSRSGTAERLLMQTLLGYRGQYVIESFNPYTLLWLEENQPQVIRGLLGDDGTRGRVGLRRFSPGFSLAGRAGGKPLPWNMPATTLKRFRAGGRAPAARGTCVTADFVAYDIDQLSPAEADSFRQMGMQLACWTVRTPGQLEKGRSLCDCVIFENQEGRLAL